MNKKTLLIGLLAVSVAGGSWLLLRKPDRASQTREPVHTVRTTRVATATVPVRFSTTGFVTPVASVEIRPQISSTVRSIKVREGDMVSAGTVLFELDTRSEDAAVARLRAQAAKNTALLADARRTLERNRELLARGFVSQGIVDGAQSAADALEATLAADQAALAEARVAAGHGTLVAPQAGRVGLINVRVGSLVQPAGAQALTTLTQIAPIDVAFSLPEDRLPQVLAAHRSGTVPVEARDGTRSHAGRLSFIDSTADSGAGGVRLKARFDNPDKQLWPGTLVQVSLQLESLKDVATVPPAAVQVGPQGQFLFVVGDDDRLSARPVKIRHQTESVAVIEGAAPGLRVVSEGGRNLRPGARVKEAGAARAAPAGKPVATQPGSGA